MNPTGRIVGGGLILLSLLWILRIAGLTPFSNSSINQVAAQIPPDRPPIPEFDASRTTIANFNPQTGTQTFGTTGGTSGSGSSTIGDLATTSGSGTGTTGTTTSSTGTTSTGTGSSSVGSTSTGTGTAGTTTPAVRAGW